jgi:hypothetical protein
MNTYVESWRGDYERPIVGSTEWFTRTCQSLSLSFDAKRKYTEDGIALPLPGYSVVNWLEKNSAHAVEIVAGELKHEFTARNLSPFTAFLPPSTYHVTLYDLMLFPSEDTEKNIIFPVERAFTHAAQMGPVAGGKLSGISICAGTSIVVWVRFEKHECLETIVSLRHHLHRELVPLIGPVLAPPESFLGHVTLAYFTRDVGEIEYRNLNEILCRYSSSNLGELRIGRAELRRFNTMDHWNEPLMAIALGNDK